MDHNNFSGDELTSFNMPASSDSSITKEGQTINQDKEVKSNIGIALNTEKDGQPKKDSHPVAKKTKPWKHSSKKKAISKHKPFNFKIDFHTKKNSTNIG